MMALPLDRKYVDGKPALDVKWIADTKFLSYSALPFTSPDKASTEEWAEQLEFIDEDLHWLLTLPHDRFWCQVIFEETVMKCIDSYLRYAPRYFDVHTIPREYKDLHDRVHRRVFMVCVRMATHKETKDNFITPSVFGEILYQNYLFDIPKIMDLCVLYGNGNTALLTKMIHNIFMHQPGYTDDLYSVVPTMLQVFSSIHRKCVDENESGSPLKLTATRRKNVLEEITDGEFQDIVFYLMDTSHTLRHFLDVYPPAATAFNMGQFPAKLANYYESIVGSLLDAIKSRDWSTDGLDDFLKEKLHLAQINLLKAFRTIAFTCYLQPLLEQSDEPTEHLIEEYFDVLSNCIAEKRFLGHLESLYPFHDDVDLITQTEYGLDETRLKFLSDGIKEAYDAHGKSSRKRVSKKEQFSALCPKDNLPAAGGGGSYAQAGDELEAYGGACAGPAVSEVELQSMLTSVKDLLPELGDGFIELCFEYLGYDVEKVIAALLEDNLPEKLQNTDRTMLRKNSALVDPLAVAEEESLLRRRKNIYDNDEFDVFSKDVDASRIHIGKADKIGDVANFLNDKSMIRANRSIYESYSVGLMEEEVQADQGEYDDEYDDTYDTHEIGADDADSADELTNRRAFTQPRIFGHQKSRRERYESESSEDSSDESRPREKFVENPEMVRERLAQRHALKQHNRGVKKPPATQAAAKPKYDVTGAPKGQGQSNQVLRNRAFKDKNKAQRANHNRKAGSDRKRMVP